MPDPGGIEGVCADLQSVVERLDGLAFDALREAVAAGERGRPELERRITRARHAVERALHHLAGAAGTTEVEEES